MHPTDSLSWRISPALPAAKLVGAAALVGLAVAVGRSDPVQWALAATVVLGLTASAVRDLVAPVRLAADASGVTVPAGLAGRRHLPWSQVEEVRVDRRLRRGLRTELLEIDTGESLHLFGAHQLGAAPDDVAAQLGALRPGNRLS